MDIPSLASNNTPALVLLQAAVRSTLSALKTTLSEDQVATSDQAKERSSVREKTTVEPSEV